MRRRVHARTNKQTHTHTHTHTQGNVLTPKDINTKENKGKVIPLEARCGPEGG